MTLSTELMVRHLKHTVAALRSAKHCANAARGYIEAGPLDSRLAAMNFDWKVYEDELVALIVKLSTPEPVQQPLPLEVPAP